MAQIGKSAQERLPVVPTDAPVGARGKAVKQVPAQMTMNSRISAAEEAMQNSGGPGSMSPITDGGYDGGTD